MKPENKVLTDSARKSGNFYKSDRILRHYLQKHLPSTALQHMGDNLTELGEKAAQVMDGLSMDADQNPPELQKRNALGETINQVDFHPSYWELMDIAAQSEMFYVKFNEELIQRFGSNRNMLGFAAGQLYAMSELGAYCPLCMTDGAAHLVDRYAPEKIKDRILTKLSAKAGEELYSGAMFITEKSGGSDVGRNLTSAEKIQGDRYKLNGEKWFCSNVNADIIMTLARTGATEEGTRGLSLFLVEKELANGKRNSMDIIRLKDKLGVRSMATGEVNFTDTIGILLGEENAGFKLMTEMINISRMYNSVAALAGSRRAIVEAYQYLDHRITFGKKATEHALIRQKLQELGSLYIGDFLLVWRAIRAMDAAESGDEKERDLMRIIIPMAKWRSAEHGVYIVRECMELMGGNGYIEDFVMPKLLRDVNVLPIWEGSGNIIVLDILRAAQKSRGIEIVWQQIEEAAEKSDSSGALMLDHLQTIKEVWQELEEPGSRDILEATAKALFKELVRLYQMALIINERDEESNRWLRPALNYHTSTFTSELTLQEPISAKRVDNLVGWDY